MRSTVALALAASAAVVKSQSTCGSVLTVSVNTATDCPAPTPDPFANGRYPTSITPGVVPSVNTDHGFYRFDGFFPLIPGRVILNGKSTIDPRMTVEYCAAICNTDYFAIENGDNCICGTVAPLGVVEYNRSPTFSCTGDPTEVCGAAGYGIVYKRVSASPSGTSSVPASATASLSSTELSTMTSSMTSLTSPASSASSSELSSMSASTSASESIASASSSAAISASSSTAAPSLSSAATASSSSDVSSVVTSSASATDGFLIAISAIGTNPPATSTATAPESFNIAISAPGQPTTNSAGSSFNIVINSATSIPGVSVPSVSPTVGIAASVSASINAPQITISPSQAATTAPASTVSYYNNPATYTPLQAAPQCPGANQGEYDDILGSAYNINCGQSVDGDVTEPFHADDFQACRFYCDFTAGCAAVTFTAPSSTLARNCIPYSTFRGYTSAPLQSGNSNSVAVPANGPMPATDYQSNLCTDPTYGDGSTYNDFQGNSYTLGCGFRLENSVQLTCLAADSLQACTDYCQLYNGCVEVNYQGQGAPSPANSCNCFPASTHGVKVANSDFSNAVYVPPP